MAKKVLKKRRPVAPPATKKVLKKRRPAETEVPAKKSGMRKAANIKGKSYSQIARDVLEKTGSRAKATAKLKAVECKSASAVVAKVATKMGIPSERSAGTPKKKVNVTKKTTSPEKKRAPKKLSPKKKKKAPEPEE